MFLALIFILFTCQEAKADHWVRTGVLDPGHYIVCLVRDNVPTHCLFAVADGSVEETQNNVDTLNGPPMSYPSDGEQAWARWDNGHWIKYKKPWKFIEGEIM